MTQRIFRCEKQYIDWDAASRLRSCARSLFVYSRCYFDALDVLIRQFFRILAVFLLLLRAPLSRSRIVDINFDITAFYWVFLSMRVFLLCAVLLRTSRSLSR